MTLELLNNKLAELYDTPQVEKRQQLFSTAFALVDFLGLELPKDGREVLLATKKEELKKYLITHPVTKQHQIYMLTKDGQNIAVRLAVLKKIRKDQLNQLIDKENKMEFQSAPKVIQGLPSAPPYVIHLVTTDTYDKLYVVLHQGDQKRIVRLHQKFTQTQFQKIIPQWQKLATKTKPEVAELFWKSLDLKEVNTDFYKLIKEQFDSLIGIANIQKPDIADKDIKQFAVRLIGRYIFCWFLREKGIISDSLIGSKNIENNKDIFFQTYLTKLFFNTLNAEVTSSERTEQITELDSLYNNIPYLNGGLFDFHPEDTLFKELDLNEWLYTFVKVLENFDFTVDESSSQYQQVAIDPEMLGRIFENLLASQNEETEKLANQRKAFGAFYTPREIVDYMVNESLKAHIETHILPALPQTLQAPNMHEPMVAYKGSLFAHLEPQQVTFNLDGKQQAAIIEIEKKQERLKGKIEKLFAPDCNTNPFDKEETLLVRKALSEITILDPACGSGAFPMGVMLRLMELRHIVGHGHKNNYELKSEILSKNIYGVDIMPMAVEIARLRAWLSLVLEAEYKPADRKNNFGIAALPNLDFKFICANSLIDSGYDNFTKEYKAQIENPKDILFSWNAEIQKLEKIRDEYFDPKGDKEIKKKLQTEFEGIKNYIKTNFKGTAKNYKLEDFLNKVDDWNPFDDSKPSSFFSSGWMFGIKDGFDVVIGNPPYVQVPKGIYSHITFPYSEGKDKGKQNLYKVFVELSYNLSMENGVGCMIVQSSLMCDLSSTFTRELLITKSQIKNILEFPKTSNNAQAQVFDSVLQGTCIFKFIKSNPHSKYNLNISINNNTVTISNPVFESINQLSLLKLYPETYYLPLIYIDDAKVLEKINSNSYPFNHFINSVNQGDLNLTSSVSQFSESVTSVKLYRGRNIHRFELLTEAVEFINEDFQIEKVNENQKNTYIVLQEITGTTDKYRLHACLTNKNEKFLFGHTANKILLNDESLNLVCMAILNSNLLDWFFRKTSTNNHVMGYEIKQLPFPKEVERNIKPINKLVNQIFTLKSQKQDTTELEKEIDVMVYKIYELTYDEVKIIDPNFWLAEEEYNTYKSA